MTVAELKKAVARLKYYWSPGYDHGMILGPMAERIRDETVAVCDAFIAMVEERNRYRIALWKIQDEVTHKKGGPEKSGCVSVPYLHGVVSEALTDCEEG